MLVAFLMRRPRATGTHSVELLTAQILANLSEDVKPLVAVSRFESSGLWRRVYNIIEAAFIEADVYHITGDVTFLSFLLDRERTVLTILDCGTIVGPPSLRKRMLKFLWFTLPIWKSRVVTVISADVKRQLLENVNVDPSKVHVVPVAVPSVYRRYPKPFNRECPVILQIGGGANKNRKRLIPALRGIRCRLVLVGVLSADDKALLKAHGIDWTNHVNLDGEQMLQAYRDADIMAFPSTYEGFGMPIVEANLVGRVVVTGNVTSMPEVGGDAACYVDPFDVASIRAGILRVIEDEAYREDLIERGYKNARRFDPAKITRQYERLYRQVAGSSSRTRAMTRAVQADGPRG